MGERLVITVKAFDEDIATIYYHWSAHSIGALEEADKLISEVPWDEAKSADELILMLTRYLENNGGGVEREDMDTFNWRFNEHFKADGNSRNCGLIAISEEAMDDQIKWSDGQLWIDFDEQVIHNDVITRWDSWDECADDRTTWDDDFNPDDYKGMKELLIDPAEFDFENLRAVIEELDDDNLYHTYEGAVYESYLW